MKFQLDYSTISAKTNISGAMPFKSSLKVKIPAHKFRKEVSSLQTATALCQELDTLSFSGKSAQDFLEQRTLSIGPRKYIREEFNHVASKGSKTLTGFLLGFPFKCPMPIKTNYHSLPDLGEMMFLYRMGKICKLITENTKYSVKLELFEETQALSPVFNISQANARVFSQSIKQLLHIMKLGEYLSVVSLAEVLAPSALEYRKRIREYTKRISNSPEKYKKLLHQILPTIALSTNTNGLSYEKSLAFIRDVFSRPITPEKDSKIFQTAFRYIAFIELQEESRFREKYYSQFLQFSLCPKMGRISVRPTLSKIKIWPHHGVPVIYVGKNKKKFAIEYFLDFIVYNQNATVTEVVDEKGGFLYYKVADKRL